MTLSRFAPPLGWRTVAYYLAGLLMLTGPCLLVPAGVAVVAREPRPAAVFAGVAVAAIAVGWLGRRLPAPELGLREALVITALAYPLVAGVSAVAYLPVAGPVDALFEAVSGFTTTGLSVLRPEQLPTSVVFFRSFTQWLGGAGLAVVYLAVLAGPRSAASRLYMAEFEADDVMGNVVTAARAVAGVYAGLTAAGYAALLAAGAGPLDGLLHAFSAVSTGGFSPFAESVGGYDSAAVATVLTGLMLAGAISLPLLYVLIARRQWRTFLGDVQLRMLVAVAAAGVAVIALFDGWQPSELGQHAFHVTSALTTTGFVVSDPQTWSEGAKLATAGLLIVGGSAGSTAGGIKLLRVALLAALVWWSVVRMLLPREARVPLTVGGLSFTDTDVRRAVAVTVCYVTLWFASALVLAGAGADAADAVFESAAALGTAGQSIGLAAELAAGPKLMLCATMWLGRIEVLPILLLLRPGQPRT